MTTHHLRVPDDVALLQFFGVEPSESDSDGYFQYDVADGVGTRLRFSFHLGERSVQTTISVGGNAVVTVSHELASEIALRNGRMECEFVSADSRTTLTIALGERIAVEWATLRTI